MVYPFSWDAVGLYVLWTLMTLIILSTAVPPIRQINLSAPIVLLFLLAMATTIANQMVEAKVTLYNLFVGLVGVKVIAERFDMNFKSFGEWMVAFAVVTLFLIPLQHLWNDETFFAYFMGERAGFSYVPWALGCTVALAFPYVLSLSWRWSLLLLPLLWYSRSTASVLAVTIGTLVYFFDKRWLKWSWILLPVGAIYGIYDNGAIDPHRLRMWKGAFNFFHNPLIGEGLGGWKAHNFMHPNGGDWYAWLWAHNEYIQHMFEQGAIGIGLIFAWLLMMYRTRFNPVVKSSLTILALLCVLHPIFHWAKLIYLVIMVVSISEVNYSNSKKMEALV